MLRSGKLSLEIRLLISYMRSLSADHHDVAWSENLEYELWEIVESGRPTKDWPLSAQEINDLQGLRNMAGCWIRYRDLEEILNDYNLDRWEQLSDSTFIIPEEQWYQIYTRDEWETVLMEKAL
jgi:hypothetical protein